MTGGRRRRGIAAGVAVLVVALAVLLVAGRGGGSSPDGAVERTAARATTSAAAAVRAVPADDASVAGRTSTSARSTSGADAAATADGPTTTGVDAAPTDETTSGSETSSESDAAATRDATTTEAASTADLPLAGRTIVVDPGHNGGNAAHPSEVDRSVRIGNGSKACDTTGTESVRGQSEHAYTWSVARQTRLALEAEGATVVLTRRDDRGVGPCITKRMPRANALGADLAVSIHGDGGPAGGRGFHVILPGRVPTIARHDRIVAPSARLGRAVRAAFRSGTGMPYSTYLGSRGLDVRTDLGGLNLIRVPGVMIETGNMQNATDARLMADGSWRRRAGRAIAAGITAWLTAESR